MRKVGARIQAATDVRVSLKLGSKSSTVKRSTIDVSVTCPLNPNCSIAMSAEKFSALHRQWRRLHMSENTRVGRKPKQKTRGPRALTVT